MLSTMRLNDPMPMGPHATQARGVVGFCANAVAPDGDQDPRPAPSEMRRMPGAARLLILGDRTTVAAQIRNRRYARLPDVAIVGPTCRPLMLTIDGPPPIEIMLSALDWVRLMPMSAALLADRIVSAADLGLDRLGDAAAIATEEAAETAIASLAETMAARGIPRDPVNEAFIARMTALIDDGRVFDTATAAQQVDVRPHHLRRLTLRAFGFPPKTLLMRRRFLAAFDVFRAGEGDFAAIAAFGYFDASHFIRDANRFLGTTPRRFVRDLAAIAQHGHPGGLLR